MCIFFSVPTFIAFLRDIESPFEVREYVRIYLGEGKDALEFASQFVERRSKVRSGEINHPENTSTTTTNSHNFQEVKVNIHNKCHIYLLSQFLVT